jgi:DNA-binding transcriptional ArsR family regulator
MGVLKAAGLVLDRRDAQWVRYRRNPDIPRSIARIVESVLGEANGVTRSDPWREFKNSRREKVSS